MKAIEKDALPWIQVSDLNEWGNAVAKLYSIKGIPHTFVWDAQTRILGENYTVKSWKNVFKKPWNKQIFLFIFRQTLEELVIPICRYVKFL